jgi:hypothetical protein
VQLVALPGRLPPQLVDSDFVVLIHADSIPNMMPTGMLKGG